MPRGSRLGGHRSFGISPRAGLQQGSPPGSRPGACQGNADNKEWFEAAKLGRLVKDLKIKSLEIYLASLIIKEVRLTPAPEALASTVPLCPRHCCSWLVWTTASSQPRAALANFAKATWMPSPRPTAV
ncbi:40S ribosomal protein S2 [Tupaia chinensis]|uniref:40S ribosomal protein S2 n=1 Tax=Tupaia chinensis TaxID=246437 RepID=L9JG68_TUPCH|nr:40S ribosomal protein S2 [Tupaia chinensis]